MTDLDHIESCCSAAKCVEFEADGVEYICLDWQDCKEQKLHEVQHLYRQHLYRP